MFSKQTKNIEVTKLFRCKRLDKTLKSTKMAFNDTQRTEINFGEKKNDNHFSNRPIDRFHSRDRWPQWGGETIRNI